MALRLRILLAMVLAWPMLTGCDAWWDRVNRTGLSRDIGELLVPFGIQAEDLACQMVDATRTGVCWTKLDDGQESGMVAGLGLWKVQSEDDERAKQMWEADGGCREQVAFDGSIPLDVYRSAVRPGALRLAGGSSFEYLLLYVVPTSGEACIQVSYAYG